MTTINLRKLSAQALDIEKRKLEASIIIKIEAIFQNMANDAANLYKSTNKTQSELLAQNYSPEFLKEIRDAMRKAIKKFGFNLRKATEKKHNINFDAENKAKLLDLKQAITIQDDNLDEKVNKINNQFLLASTLFIANESEKQNNYVTETNARMIDDATIKGIATYSSMIEEQDNEIQQLNSQLITVSDNERSRLVSQIETEKNKRENIINTQNVIIAEVIRETIVDKAQSRSELIASQNVGLAESWSRQTEAELIDGAALISVTKTWSAILDNKTRSSHVEADGQEVGVNEPFVVGGEALKMPRDPNGSAKNIINCRCNAEYGV